MTREDQPVTWAENQETIPSIPGEKGSENGLFAIAALEGMPWLLLTRLST